MSDPLFFLEVPPFKFDVMVTHERSGVEPRQSVDLPTNIRVLVVEDHGLVRQGIIALLRGTAGMEVVGGVGEGSAALDEFRARRPDVVLMDLAMPGLDGVSCIRQICGERPGTRVIAVSAFDDRAHIVNAFRAGAVGYVVKDAVLDDLVAAIRTVHAGGRYASDAASSLVFSGLASSGDDRSDELTPREREVLTLLAGGKAMKEAAAELHISTKTVETHRRAIIEKLQLFSVAELTKHAIRAGYASL